MPAFRLKGSIYLSKESESEGKTEARVEAPGFFDVSAEGLFYIGIEIASVTEFRIDAETGFEPGAGEFEMRLARRFIVRGESRIEIAEEFVGEGEFRVVICAFRRLADFYAQAADEGAETILIDVECFAAAVVTLRIVGLAFDVSVGEFDARIDGEAVFIGETFPDFGAEGCAPYVVIAVQLVAVRIEDIVFVIEFRRFENDVRIAAVIMLPSAVDADRGALEIRIAVSDGSVTGIVGESLVCAGRLPFPLTRR